MQEDVGMGWQNVSKQARYIASLRADSAPIHEIIDVFLI